MSLDPAILAALAAAGAPPQPDAPPATRRRLIDEASDRVAAAATEPGPTDVTVTDHRLPSPGGELLIRLYEPAAETRGAHLLIHGGSWAQGSPLAASVDATARERAASAEVVVASTSYRLAPEHPHPAALEDVRRAWGWLVAEAADRGLGPSTRSVGGQSAGANLAAALCLVLRQEGADQPILQLLEVPALDLTLGHLATVDLPGLSDTSGLQAIVAEYVPDPDRRRDPLVSPLLADDLSGLAPAHVMVAELDPLRGDGLAFAQRLSAAGVAATCTVHDGHVHVSPTLTATFEPARVWRTELLRVLAEAHAD